MPVDLAAMRKTHKEIVESDGGEYEMMRDWREMVEEIEYLREALQTITHHKPGTPGLHYESIEGLLDSAIGHATAALEYPSQVYKSPRKR